MQHIHFPGYTKKRKEKSQLNLTLAIFMARKNSHGLTANAYLFCSFLAIINLNFFFVFFRLFFVLISLL